MSASTPPLHCLLYRSHLAPDRDIACVSEIIKTARSFNPAHGLTGILVFDGQRFFQYLEGPQPALQRLAQSICHDPRHTAYTELYRSDNLSQPRFEDWAMAYVLADEEEPLEAMATLDGQEALEQLLALLPALDIG